MIGRIIREMNYLDIIKQTNKHAPLKLPDIECFFV